MDTLTFTDQTGYISRYINVATDDAGKKAALSAAYNEASQSGRNLIALTYTTDSLGVSAIKFGLSPDVSYTDVTTDTAYGSVLPAGSTLMGLLVKNTTTKAISISGDVVAGGSNLFNSSACNALPVGSSLDYAATYIPINYAVGAVAESFYLSSADWNGASLDIELKISL